MNGTFVFVLLIIAIVMTARIVETWMKQRNKAAVTGGEADEMLAKIDLLEERIRVLERIVTEHNIDLKQQIDNL